MRQDDKERVRDAVTDSRTVKKISKEMKRRRTGLLTSAEQSEALRQLGPTPLEAIVGGRTGLISFALTRGRQFVGERVFGTGRSGAAGVAGKQKFARFQARAAGVAAKAVAIEKIATVGLPILSQLTQDAMKDVPKNLKFTVPGPFGVPLPIDVSGAMSLAADAMREVTDAVQTMIAQVFGTLKTVGEFGNITKGVALGALAPAKVPELLQSLHAVNTYDSKYKQNLEEAAIREGTSLLGDKIKSEMADFFNKTLIRGSNK